MSIDVCFMTVQPLRNLHISQLQHQFSADIKSTFRHTPAAKRHNGGLTRRFNFKSQASAPTKLCENLLEKLSFEHSLSNFLRPELTTRQRYAISECALTPAARLFVGDCGRSTQGLSLSDILSRRVQTDTHYHQPHNCFCPFKSFLLKPPLRLSKTSRVTPTNLYTPVSE